MFEDDLIESDDTNFARIPDRDDDVAAGRLYRHQTGPRERRRLIGAGRGVRRGDGDCGEDRGERADPALVHRHA